jgi:integrase
VLSEPEADALIPRAALSAHRQIRVLIAWWWRCGLRISQAPALECRDVDLEQDAVRVRHGQATAPDGRA